MEESTNARQARDFAIYTVASIGVLLFFNLGHAYKGENEELYIIIAALLLLDLVYYLICYTNKDKFLSSLFFKARMGLISCVFLNAAVMAYFGPNQIWFLAIIIFLIFMRLEKRAFLSRHLAIMEKYGLTEKERAELEAEEKSNN